MQTGSRITLLLGITVLIACVYLIQSIYINRILPDKQAAENYLQTSCFLISKQIKNRDQLMQAYRADFLISYNVKGVQYNRWVSGNGMDMSFSRNLKEQQHILSQFTIGGTYTCWYNQYNPQLSVLIKRHNWLSIFPLLVPSVLGLIALYYVLIHFSLLMSLIAQNKTTVFIRQ